MAIDSRKIGIVLSAGGARAAYQVGVISYLAETFPEFEPAIYTGVSAGSINAAFLAQGDPIKSSARKAYELWSNLTFDQVFQTNFHSFLRMFLRWGSDLFLSKLTNRLLLKSLLDATPLFHTLLSHIQFSRISRAIKEGRLAGVAVTATNYHDGTTTTFFDSSPDIKSWSRERRTAVKTALRVRHIMASCSIPILFEPVPIGPYLYGDGSLRFSFPFSPALHLGAEKIIAVGIRCPTPKDPFSRHRPDKLSLGFVAGSVLNSIFLDSLEFDFETVSRINEIVGEDSPNHVPVCLLRPSQDLGTLAGGFLSEVPFHMRQVLRATARPEELGDLLSYLMFSPGYIRALLELGRRDAAEQKSSLSRFLSPRGESIILDPASPKGTASFS